MAWNKEAGNIPEGVQVTLKIPAVCIWGQAHKRGGESEMMESLVEDKTWKYEREL